MTRRRSTNGRPGGAAGLAWDWSAAGARRGVRAARGIGFLLDLEHVGWACAAALMVMRPAAELQRLRSAGRILAVTVGALLAIALVRLSPPAACYSLAAIGADERSSRTEQAACDVTGVRTTGARAARPENTRSGDARHLLLTMNRVLDARATGRDAAPDGDR